MIVTGKPIEVGRSAAGTALVDAVIEGDLLEGAHRVRASAARARPAAAQAARPASERSPMPRHFSPRARAHAGEEQRGFPAPRRSASMRSRRRCSLPFDEGVKFERALLRRAARGRRIEGAAPRFFRRARGGENPRRARRHARPGDQQRRRHRRRHHGRRHRHGFANAGIPVKLLEVEARSAGPRPGRDPRELREHGLARPAAAGRKWTSAWRASRRRSTGATCATPTSSIEAVFEDMAGEEGRVRAARRA